MIYLRFTGTPGHHNMSTCELVDSKRESGAYVELVVARGYLVPDGEIPQGGKVDVALRFVGESTEGR